MPRIVSPTGPAAFHPGLLNPAFTAPCWNPGFAVEALSLSLYMDSTAFPPFSDASKHPFTTRLSLSSRANATLSTTTALSQLSPPVTVGIGKITWIVYVPGSAMRVRAL